MWCEIQDVTIISMMQKEIIIDYYALLREHRGCDSELWQTEAVTVEALYEELHACYSFPIHRDYLKVAVNDALTGWGHALSDKDRVVFICPVAGG